MIMKYLACNRKLSSCHTKVEERTKNKTDIHYCMYCPTFKVSTVERYNLRSVLSKQISK